MRIRTQLTIDVALFGAILVIIAGSLFDTNRQAERLNRQLEVARSLEQGAAELGYLANDYLLHHELPQCTRMEARFSSFSASFSLLSPSSPEQQALANGIAAGRRQLKAVLDEMVSASGSAPPAPDAAAELAWIRLSWSRFQVLIQGMVFDTSRQSLLLHEQMDRLKQTSILLIFSLIGASAAYFLTSYLLIYRRAIRSISRLQAGTRIIGAGNLDFRLEEGAGDEIGQLAGAFNRMTAGLKEVTASKTELEREMAERRRAEREREMTIEFLHLVNRSTSTRELIETAVGFFQRQSGCEAVGVRLRDGEDYPYFEARGFPPQFVATENSLCTRDPTGRIQRDHAGDPVLSCMCGNVICGRFDPAKPFFTSAGSFWTSSTTELLAATCEADRLARTRNRCNGEGYESVALIALRLGEERLGLLQLNGRRKGVFSPATIALWERLAGYFAVALAKFRAEQALQEANETLEARVAERTALAESRTRQLQALAVQLSEAEERERRRVADLLHDDLQQILASARLRLQAAQAGGCLPQPPWPGWSTCWRNPFASRAACLMS